MSWLEQLINLSDNLSRVKIRVDHEIRLLELIAFALGIEESAAGYVQHDGVILLDLAFLYGLGEAGNGCGRSWEDVIAFEGEDFEEPDDDILVCRGVEISASVLERVVESSGKAVRWLAVAENLCKDDLALTTRSFRSDVDEFT